MSAPDWTDYAIGWHIYPLGFTGAPVHPGSAAAAEPDKPRLAHIADWFDYVQKLGTNVVQLGPIFESVSHGYDTLDFYRIDERLGDDDAFAELIAAAHERGIKVLLDGVFNHVARDHHLVQEALADADSDAAALFGFDDSGNLQCFEGHESLVEFNHDSAAVRELITDVMKHWLGRGIDGWRLDAAYAVAPEFWAQVLPEVRAEYPHAFIYGEVIHGDYVDIVNRSGLDSVTEYELWKATWSSLKENNFYELEWTLGRHNGFQDAFRPVTFIGNHDVTRIASQVGSDKAVLALVVLMTVGGVPLVYYGDEQGYTGIKEERFGGDDQVRPLFPPTPEELSELGEPVFQAHQALISLRRRNPWLQDARVEITSVDNERIVWRSVSADGANGIDVELDITEAARAKVTEANGESWYWSAG
ncbi:alpha-amylase family protein [Corynebacterium sp. TAE3-ERU12]|uniref:alpha-amylase family protein n=1 Tax=Corynebacterium sp. TAE3-ERU12 TaxID=2849491 RepID=UPI001C493913|nr:alpha-amylase family protein [Corynebacterium sp. TAE3-ERU12]MBV7295023.1 alpha-amylase family protein [Corynebacterium sp. TAE3-ERU12]